MSFNDRFWAVTAAAGVLFTGLAPADAGVPRGLVLSADEQIADATTGITIARGRAQITAEKYAIAGQAETIEVRPLINEILLKGAAQLSVGERRYSAEMLSCTLDFARCVAVDADQPLPASALGAAEMAPR